MNPLRAGYAIAYNVVSTGLRVWVWASTCTICGKRFNTKTTGLGSPCRRCNQRLLQAQASLEALDVAKLSERDKKFVSDLGA
jgi:hypothetical protein